jgi:broad specificity phosphatase PhoE
MAPNRIMFIRHAEKPDEGHDGVASDGSADKESLIVRGWQRAGALARFFRPTSGPSDLTPTTIFAAAVVAPDSKSKRPTETVKPLVKLLEAEEKLTVKDDFITTYLKDDTEGLMEAVLEKQRTVLIAWEHQRIPDAVKKLPHAPPAPKKWPDDRFDMVWVFDQAGTGWTFSQIPQLLLAGDSASPIT